ncbi:general substrate transporter [Punctularia strigosozonata HHB-11173 SS5]|uniref:general substrate transporter n=1 Tax=Punctularia strigosozonata (strain HHB-11173) TaxID=741275 RepID=UPI00044182A2|nr:general substrate transporter [Punctularia strigosozonata HHB-11173 SS5]EIN09409.1 general substrate transporter [Punctularia strigosozonata HHB-11173 SS5]
MPTLFYVQGAPVGVVATMVGLLASVGGLVFGYDTGQISDILLLDDFKQRFAICTDPTDVSTCAFSKVRSGAIVGFFSVGTFFGSFGAAYVSDFLGRRRTMMLACLVYMVGLIIQLSASHAWVQYAMGRMVGGFGVGTLSVVVPMYQGEMSLPQIRGTVTAMYQLFVTFGILLANCVSIGARSIDSSGSWRTIVGLGLIWPLTLISGMIFMPESPRWLTGKGRMDDARVALARVRAIPAANADQDETIAREMDAVIAQAEAEKGMTAGWLDCFKPGQKTLYRTILGMALQSFQQLTGANYFFYFGATIFQSVGISDSFVTQIVLGAVNFVCTFGGLYVLGHFGRRWPLIIGGLWQSAWLFVFAAVGTARDPTSDQQIGSVMVASACMFILGFATTWAPGTWVVIGESFGPRTRAKQSALATGSNWFWNFLISFFTPYISGSIGYAYGFVFAGCNLAAALAVSLFSYESSELTLEAVDMMYNDPNCKPWTSHRWAPPGFNTRQEFTAAEASGHKSGVDVAHHEHKILTEHSPAGSDAHLRTHAV